MLLLTVGNEETLVHGGGAQLHHGHAFGKKQASEHQLLIKPDLLDWLQRQISAPLHRSRLAEPLIVAVVGSASTLSASAPAEHWLVVGDSNA